MLEKIMTAKKRVFREKQANKGNGYCLRNLKTILGKMKLEVPGTRNSGFKPFILPERKRIVFLFDDIIKAVFNLIVSMRKTSEI